MKNSKKDKRCPVYENCGGCALQGLSYDEQLELKQKRIDNLLSDFCHVDPIIGNLRHLNYRNKAQVTFGKDDKGRVIVGNFVPSTHIIVPIKECEIVDKKANKIIETVKELVIKYNISIFNENSLKGCMRHVQIRCGNCGQYMVILVTGTNKIYNGDLLIKDLIKKHSEIKTVIQNINYRHTSMVLGNKNVVLYGSGYIRDKLCDLDFSISPTAFYQVNKYQTEVLYEKALELAELKGDEVAIDAYCGIGTISLLLSKKVKEVVGVEINHNAIKDANFNAKLNKINNVSFIADDAGRYMSRISKSNQGKVDVVCMDPPRNGADEKFLSSLVELGPKKVIYISCGPDSLKNNLFYLTKHGYKVDHIQPVDMFPYTEHVETIVILTKSATTFNQLKKGKRRLKKKTIWVSSIIATMAILGISINFINTNFINVDNSKTISNISEETIEDVNETTNETLDANEAIDNITSDTNTGLPLTYGISFETLDDGYDIYKPVGSGYRYGPSIIKNLDGSIDVWFSSPGSGTSEWDYIRYRHMDSDGVWSSESVVLKPTAGSSDHYSVCDPGVIYFNDYYYLAYTSTDDSSQMNNSIFVARSIYPNGPFEKWNGEDWGGDPEPIIYYEPQDGCWGAGEASFVVKDDTLYLYYSWLVDEGFTTRLMTAPLDDDWPSKLEYQGIVLKRMSEEDSMDVTYVDYLDKFVGFADVYKMTGYSGVGVYVSDDGLNFTLSDVVRSDLKIFAHNLGISKGLDGHIDFNDRLILGYAYSPNQTTTSWGRWATRFQTIKLYTFVKGE